MSATIAPTTTASHRASFHVNAEKLVHAPVDPDIEHPQQQESPQLVHSANGKCASRAACLDVKRVDNDDNNQEEEGVGEKSPGVIEAASTEGVPTVMKKLLPARTPPKPTKHKPEQLRQLRQQAALNHDPPLTTARLRQENAALQHKIVQLGNQHESEVRALQAQLFQLTSSHELTEQKMKKQIVQLEKRQSEAAANAKKYQVQVETMTLRLRELEVAATALQQRSYVPAQVKSQSVTPLPLQRRGNGSPLPYRASRQPVKPFTWREDTGRARVVRANMPPPPAATQPLASDVTNQYRSTTLSPERTTRTYPSYMSHESAAAVVPAYHPSTTPHTTPSQLPATSPPTCRPASLVKKPSGGLLAYCADLITSTIAPLPTEATEVVASPSMKVMPAWQYQQQQQNQKCSLPTSADPSEYTAIPIPLAGSVNGDASVSAASATSISNGLLSTASSKLTSYLSTAVLPIHANSPC